MNAERLIAHYERIADALDAIPRLRRFILDLAGRGKLVPQDPNDEPASELLKRIAAEKTRLVMKGAIRKERSLPEVELGEIPYGVPEAWKWARIRKITSDRGQRVPDREFTYIDVTAINKEAGRIEEVKVTSATKAPSRARKVVQKGDMLYSCVRPYLLNIAIVEDDFSPPPIASTAFAVLHGFDFVLAKYQWTCCVAHPWLRALRRRCGGKRIRLSTSQTLRSCRFPSPPSPSSAASWPRWMN